MGRKYRKHFTTIMHFYSNNFFLTLIIYTLTFTMRMQHCNANSGEIVSEFSPDYPSIRLINLAVNENEGCVYVSSRPNHLYQLSADLKLQTNYTLLEFNSSNCTSDHNCSYKSHNDDCVTSFLFEIDYQNQQLISCHVCDNNNILSQLEICHAHNISNISEILSSATEYYVAYKKQYKYFIAPSLIHTSSALYYVYNFFGSLPIITIARLDRERFLSYDKQISMNFNTDKNFIYGFNSGDSNYILTTGISFRQQAINSKVPIGGNLIEIRHEGQNYQFDDVPLIYETLKNEPQTNPITLEQAYFFEHKSASELQTDSHEIKGKILFTAGRVHDDSTYRGFRVCAYNMSNIHPTIQKRRMLTGEIIYDYVGNTAVRGMIVTSINNHIVLFIGTWKGHLLKISIKLDSFRGYTANIYADITIDEGTILHPDMQFDSKKNFLYAMNFKKLAKIKIHNCDAYNTLYACLDAKDPYCGWCFLRNRCCLKSECLYKKNRIDWISYDVDKYINMSSSPRNEFSNKAEWNVTFNLLNSHPLNDHKIICSFRFDNTTINTTTHVSNENEINCLTPNPKDLPPTPIDEHSIKAQLSVQTNLIPEFQKIEVEFFDCSTYKLCSQCPVKFLKCANACRSV